MNINLGILGHIDSGKTSLCRALSTITSTASLDKHPQSQERGITLDLGFSSFSSPPPQHFKDELGDKCPDVLQFCLVDCPGHASLIRTVIGGAQIIDMCCLVIDAQKGIQTQTAECIVVAELLANQLLVIVNKIDMFPEEERADKLNKLKEKLKRTFRKTKFSNIVLSCVSATANIGLDDLIENGIKKHLRVPQRTAVDRLFLLAFDHAFPIKGQGTVVTGTILSGTVKPGAIVDIPQLEDGKGKKVRSIQMFKKSVKQAKQGDRVAVCIPQTDANKIERGLVIDPKFPVPKMTGIIAVCQKLSYFKYPVNSKAKFHLTIGHETVMAKAFFFGPQVTFPAARRNEVTNALKDGVIIRSTVGDNCFEACSLDEAAIENQKESYGLGQGALVLEKLKEWPTSLDPRRIWVHLDEAFEEATDVHYVNTDGDNIELKLSTSDATTDDAGGNETASATNETVSPKKKAESSTIVSSSDPRSGPSLEFHCNGRFVKKITELVYVQGNRLKDQDRQPIGATITSPGAIGVRKKDEVLYLLYYMCRAAGVPLYFDEKQNLVDAVESRKDDVTNMSAVVPSDNRISAAETTPTEKGDSKTTEKLETPVTEMKPSQEDEATLDKKEKKEKKKEKKSKKDDKDATEAPQEGEIQTEIVIGEDGLEYEVDYVIEYVKKEKKKKDDKKEKKKKESKDAIDVDDVKLTEEKNADTVATSSSVKSATVATSGKAAATDDKNKKKPSQEILATNSDVFMLTKDDMNRTEPVCYVYLDLETPVAIPENSLLIGSKLDFDVHTGTNKDCRIAFFGKILDHYNFENQSQVQAVMTHNPNVGPKYRPTIDDVLDIVKMREKVGKLEKIDKTEKSVYIVSEMFKADTDLALFRNLRVVHEPSGTQGIIEGNYGTDGLVRVRFDTPNGMSTAEAAAGVLPGVRLDKKGNVIGKHQVILYFKKTMNKTTGRHRILQ